MMDSSSTTNDQQAPPAAPINNSSSRRKQSKPNRLEHVVVESTPACEPLNSTPALPSLTQYHVAAEQQESGLADDDSDRVSLHCEDGSLSSHSLGEHFAMEDILNRSRRPSHQPATRATEKGNFDGSLERMLIEENEQQDFAEQDRAATGALDFSLKLADAARPSNARARSLNSTGKARSLKRKHQNGSTDNNNGNTSMPTRIFHADAFCSICRKEFCNKYFLKTHLANKHGIFDPQSATPSASAPSLVPMPGVGESAMDSAHPFTVMSTLMNNGHEDFSSSANSPASDLLRNPSTHDDDNEAELSSLRNEMNGVIAGDDEHDHPQHDDDDDDDDDEQDGVNSLMHLPRKVATMLSSDHRSSRSDRDDDDPQELAGHSPSNSHDFSQQAASSSAQLAGLSSTSSSTTASGSRQSSAKLPEDFCDICQKHFCNKYYLRKHRLDVHGVQTDSNIKPYKRIDSNALSTKGSSPTTSSQQLASSMQLPSSFSNVAFNPSSVQQSLGMLLNPIFSPLVQSQSNAEQAILSSGKRRHADNSNDSSKSQFPPSLLNVASDVASAFANQLSSVAGSASGAASNSSSKSQISTCHLCGKKFQSPEYLQLHLLNKHQIAGELASYESPQPRSKSSSSANSSANGSSSGNAVKKIKLETSESSGAAGLKSSSALDAIGSSNAPPTMPGIVDTYFAAKMADRVSCDICHKQVCNKYFLKTHKLKVHGVSPDSLQAPSAAAIARSEAAEDNLDLQHSRSSVDGSPPQLVVDELNAASGEPGVIPSPDALTASVNSFIGTSSGHDTAETSSTSICELCSKSFPTKFFHVHMNNAHGIQQAPLSTTNGSGHSTSSHKSPSMAGSAKRPLSNGGNLSGSSTVRLKQTPQVQLRVTCQVCKKELCNKYFLRAHMRNVHNISVDDLRLLHQQSSASGSTSQHSPSSEHQSSKSSYSVSSNILPSSTSTLTSDLNHASKIKRSLSNDNDVNGHDTDSNESENINLPGSSSSFPTTTKLSASDNNNNNNPLLSMQPFLVESDDDLYKDLFVPCMVYLPCRHRVTKPLEVSLRLKPVDNTAATSPTATATVAD